MDLSKTSNTEREAEELRLRILEKLQELTIEELQIAAAMLQAMHQENP